MACLPFSSHTLTAAFNIALPPVPLCLARTTPAVVNLNTTQMNTNTTNDGDYSNQKFFTGDLVQVSYMMERENKRPIRKTKVGIVSICSTEIYWSEIKPEYSIFFKGIGRRMWFKERQLELVENEQFDLLNKWRKEIAVPVIEKTLIPLTSYLKTKGLIK